MADSLLDRLDRYVIALLDEAERADCGEAAKGDTQNASEEGPGNFVRASLSDRVALLKAATAYINVRSGKKQPDEPDEEPPEIDGFVTRLRPKQPKNRADRG